MEEAAFASWVGPAVTAAIVSGAVAIVSLIANVLLTLNMHGSRLKAEATALERRGELDRELAERKARLERALALQKRKAEIAEQVLADFYECQRIFETVRSPMIWAHEMVPEEGVSDEQIKNGGYGVLRRLRAYNEFFPRLEARRFTAAALLGPAALEPYKLLIREHNRVVGAAQALMRHDKDDESNRPFIVKQRAIAFATDDPDEVTEKLKAITAQVEKLCRPVLEADGPLPGNFPETADIDVNVSGISGQQRTLKLL